MSTEEGRKIIAYRQKMAVNSSPMSPEAYAAAVVKKIENHDLLKIDYYNGSYSWAVYWTWLLVPRWAYLPFLRKKFRLNAVWSSLKAKFNKGEVVLESKKLV
ncbi:unnamed protein product [Ambrosiozyma monospora]|uniref:Unnamed protein product n=1 Tax=Ambrosiozyma monospora TaxID=43982 RepID=A0ACB5TCT1_AMBMO|nr:unnamed protein product [Ambrosiozyma monospora]